MGQNKNSGGWGSRLGFILASAGSAVGLGAIWKFPYMAGTNGGAVFMLPFIFFTLTIGIALLTAEFAMGRAGRQGAVGSLRNVAGRFWGWFGGIGVFTVFLILSFYSAVGGWCIKYMADAATGDGLIPDAAQLTERFGGFVSDPVLSYAYLLAFLAATAFVVMKGVESGIEKVAKVLMPALFILMVILIIRGVTLPGGWKGVEFLFTPRLSDFNGSALFNAMGFSFFSLSLGAGTMITYGSYLNPKADLPSSVGWVAFLAILSAILGGLMVMPAVFAFSLDPGAGPGLTFVTMPAVFSQMPFGSAFATAFYVCLFVAALTSSVSMLEACVAFLMQEAGFGRFQAIVAVLIGTAAVGFCANMSFGPWGDVTLFGKNIFDLLDYVTSNVGMPLSSFGIAIAAAWVAWPVTKKELQSARSLSPASLAVMRFLIGFCAPVFVAAVAIGSL